MKPKTKLRRLIKFLLTLATIATFAFILLWLVDLALERNNLDPTEKIEYGVTFSIPYTRSFGLDPEVVYQSILSDLGVKKIRIPVYWDEVEKEEGVFDFAAFDKLLDIANSSESEVILAIGYKVPRWPECFTPSWAKDLNQSNHQEKILKLLEKTVDHFKNRPEIIAWQVENEPLLTFGDCRTFDELFLKKEVELVRARDNRPIVLTDSGELGLWVTALRYSDLMGTSLYRTVYNPVFGFFRYPFPSLYYRLKAYFTQKIFAPNSLGVFVSELQAEPWAPDKPLSQIPIEEQTKTFNLEEFKEVVKFTARTGITEQYLWGAEWWYWMKKQGHPEYWEYAKSLFR